MRASSLRLLSVAFALVLVIGFAADARAQGVYVGGAYSWATVDTEYVNADLLDDNASAYKLFLGYEFPRFLGLEAGYVDFGSYDISFASQAAHEVSSTGWTAALTGYIPLGKFFTVYGKVGYFFWDAEFDAADDLGDLVDNGEDPFYGAGLRVNFDRFSILGEYEKFDSNELSSDLFSLGIRFTF